MTSHVQRLMGGTSERATYRRAQKLTDDVLRQLQNLESCPFFLFTNYLDAHAPYEAPEPYRHKWGGLSPSFVPGGSGFSKELTRAIELGEVEVTDEMRRHLAALYDGELSYIDAHLGRLLDYLDSNERLYENTMVVVTSDHGEGLGEHNGLGHRRSLYNHQVHIPLLVKLPSRYTPPLEIETNRLVQLVDIFATVHHVAGLELPDDIDGIPLHETRPLAFSEFTTVAGEQLVPETAIFEGDLKYYSSPQSELLFDLAEDPGELHNLAGDRPKQVEHFREIHRAHRHRARLRFPDTPARTLSEEELLRLRALGYVQ
jgi:arylsulfatase A-like enzyme